MRTLSITPLNLQVSDYLSRPALERVVLSESAAVMRHPLMRNGSRLRIATGGGERGARAHVP
jgi:hypothetical protein